jgi:hypothetical protein
MLLYCKIGVALTVAVHPLLIQTLNKIIVTHVHVPTSIKKLMPHLTWHLCYVAADLLTDMTWTVTPYPGATITYVVLRAAVASVFNTPF